MKKNKYIVRFKKGSSVIQLAFSAPNRVAAVAGLVKERVKNIVSLKRKTIQTK